MKAEISVQVAGERCALAAPAGAWEKFCETEGMPEFPYEFAHSLNLGIARPKEVNTFLAVALEFGGSGVSVERFTSEVTYGEQVSILFRLCEKSLRDDSGNWPAAAFPSLTGTGSERATSS